MNSTSSFRTFRPAVFAACLLLLCITSGWMDASGAIRLPSIIGSNMVLQRNSEWKIWGWADPGEKIMIRAGWMPTETVAITGEDGKWMTRVPTGNAGGPYMVVVQGKSETVALENILLGEVWVCSGQSNMDFTIRMFGGWDRTYPEERDELLQSGFRDIRLFTVGKDTSIVPRDDCQGRWLVADTATVADFSATAWFYGVELYKNLNVPVGLIASAWGGTSAEAWTPRHIIQDDSSLAYYRDDPNRNTWFPTNTSVLFNTMINPLVRTSIRGVIWYQGEANVNDASTYPDLMAGLIRGWRQAWGRGDFPFYYVQIAPFTYSRAVVGALMREAQLKCLGIANTGMAVTMDITGDVTDIHPKNKQAVGKRLALWALSGTYGKDNIECSGPLFSGFRTDGRGIRITFDHAGDVLRLTSGGKSSGFMVAGEDRRFVPARAQVEGNTVFVHSEYVKAPVAVRYAFANTSEATLFNSAGLPASTFRTDDWPVVTSNVFMQPVYDEGSGTIEYELISEDKNAAIHYTLDSSEPFCKSPLYKERLRIMRPVKLTARACKDGIASESIGSWEISQHKGMAAKVGYLNRYSAQYSAGGSYGLVDGAEGSVAFNDGRWQGFQGDDLSVTIDLGEQTLINRLELHFLSDPASWIFLPKHVEIKTSKNGESFDIAARFDNIGDLANGSEEGKMISTLKSTLMKSARYIKVTADNIGVCPPGHPGAGEKAWLFVDEVVIE